MKRNELERRVADLERQADQWMLDKIVDAIGYCCDGDVDRINIICKAVAERSFVLELGMAENFLAAAESVDPAAAKRLKGAVGR